MKFSSTLKLEIICTLMLAFHIACNNPSRQNPRSATSQSTPSPVKSRSPETSNARTPVSPPPAPKVNRELSIEQLAQMLEAYLPPEAQGKVRRSPLRHVRRVEAWFEIAPESESVLREKVRRYATDYLIAAFKSEVDIESVSIAIDLPQGESSNTKLLSIELGVKRGAELRGKQWAKWPANPDTFFNWLNQHKETQGYREPRDRVELKGQQNLIDMPN
jgi:hypothetical protein